MELLRPTLAVLSRFYMPAPGTVNPNVKLLLSKELNRLRADAGDRRSEDSHGGDSGYGAVTRTVYDVIRNDRLLGYVIEKASGRKLKKIQDHITVILKTGAYLLLFSVQPGYAVVNEMVSTVKGKAKSFVNAVLRKIARDKAALLNEIENLSQWDTRYSIPGYLIEELKKISSRTRENLEYLNRDPLFHIRVNRREYDYPEVRDRLNRKGIGFEELPAFFSFQIKESGRVIRELSSNRMVYFQNTGSQLISILAGLERPRKVLDCCAAPGTKSVTLSQLMPEPGTISIVANDIHPGRTALMQSFLRDFQIPGVMPLNSDIVSMPFRSGAGQPGLPFDLIIVDAPCSSAGTLRKNPDLKLKINRESVQRNARLQTAILEEIIRRAAGKRVDIIYSVCSFTEAETDGVLETVLKRAGNGPKGRVMETVDCEETLRYYGFHYKTGEHGYYLLPDHRLNNDMFYISLLRG